MRGNERRNLTLKKGCIRTAKALRIMCILLPALWMVFFIFLRLVKIELPRTTDIIILGSVIAACFLLLIIESVYTKKKCRCPYCGRPWSMMKYREFKRYPLDLINDTREYNCYNCKEHVDIV